MWFDILIILSFLFNLYTIIQLFKKLLKIEDKTYNELQNYLNVSKPDKLFKRYYDYFENYYLYNQTQNKVENQVITIEFNENYKNYHAGKACMSDIINNLNYTYKELMNIDEQPKLICMKNKSGKYIWHLKTNSKNIDLSKESFNNTSINFHINYIDLNHIAKTIKRDNLDELSNTFKKLTLLNSSQYIIYDIYTNKFINIDLSNLTNTWNDYINNCLKIHYSLMSNVDNFDNFNNFDNLNDIVLKFKNISRKYDWMFEVESKSENNNNLIILNLYTLKNSKNKMALPNPDGLIVNYKKMV